MIYLFFTLLVNFSFAFEDPTHGKPITRWLYQEQLKPIVKEAGEPQHLILLSGVLTGTLVAQPFDRRVRDHRNVHGDLLVGRDEANMISDVSHGWLEIGASLLTLGFDTPEGVKLTRALIFTTVSTGLLKIAVAKKRPDQSNRTSWPSGHTSSMFAVAGSLSASYGIAAAFPAYTAAAFVSVSRIKENEHWLSDVVGGAFLGTYWAMVSADVKKGDDLSVMPIPVGNGGMILVQKSF